MARKSQKLRDAARGQECVLQSYRPGDHDPEKVVLAHLPNHDSGMGMKCPDYLAAHLCYDCHTYIDGEGRNDSDLRDKALRLTLNRLFEQGVLRVG